MSSGGKKPKGEVHEVINALEVLSAQNGQRPDVVQNKRDCFQKLIRYMTQGIDMSAAFVPATKCVALSKHDLPLKKMLYLYLRTAAKQNAAVALLVVQTLLNDCKDLDPTIRGLAVRSMAGLRVPELMDSVFQAVDGGLKDGHPYVREAAVMGVLKCYHQDAAGVRMRGLLDRVETLLSSDSDPQVVANCLYVMQQVGMLEGRVTRQLIISLLNHIRSFRWVLPNSV
jgi:vesicle coat complex subunit